MKSIFSNKEAFLEEDGNWVSGSGNFIFNTNNYLNDGNYSLFLHFNFTR